MYFNIWQMVIKAKDRKTKVKTDRTKRAEAMKASKKEYLENVKEIFYSFIHI